MCGFAGLLNPDSSLTQEEYLGRLQRMTQSISHRGPDDEDFWIDPAQKIGLGFRRLSILDLSPLGKQPMASACGRYRIAFNGEIYNHKEIKKSVEESGYFPFEFRGRSDTEVLLSAITAWGFEKTLQKLNGMFAIALWDQELQKLFLSRDRIGEKPLFYGWVQNQFVFGSELKTLTCLPGFERNFDTQALSLYFRHSCIPAPYTPFQNLYKLRPGHFLEVSASSFTHPKIAPYWSALEVCQREGNRKSNLEDETQHLHELLKDSVKIRMEADVPLGAFLSGGIDSSLVVSLMQTQSSLPIKTFTIGFKEKRFDESIQARDIAKHLGTDHTELTVTSQDAQDTVPFLSKMMDEPFGDASLIPTFLVAKLAKQKLTVALSGDGGDELFCGYPRYILGKKFLSRFGNWNPIAKEKLALGIRKIPLPLWNKILSQTKWTSPGEKINKFAEALTTKNPLELYQKLTSHFDPPKQITLETREPPTLLNQGAPPIDNPIELMMALDLVTYLPDDILVKVDRATMAVSLEGRMPLLDHRLVELAWTFPLDWKLRNGQGKWILKKILKNYVPESLYERPKMGFSVPVGDWIRGPLRDWAEELLKETKIKNQGILQVEPVRMLWRKHLLRERNHQHQLWDILMFQDWLSFQ